MKRYKIVIELNPEEEMNKDDLDKYVKSINELFASDYNLSIDWKQTFKFKTEAGTFYMEGKDKQGVRRKWKMIHPEKGYEILAISTNIGDTEVKEK